MKEQNESITSVFNDKLIADFMGVKNVFEYKLKEKEGVMTLGLYIANSSDGDIDYTHDGINFIQYGYSFDWLMPVIEKIEKQGCIVEIWLSLGKGCRIMKPTNTPCIVSEYEGNSLMEVIYGAIIGYVKWYNENGKVQM
jgi:hypothetical protein